MKLELHDTIISWNSPLLYGLTSLSISCVPIEYAASLRQILAILRQSPSLQDLLLHEVFGIEELLPPEDVVVLDHLQTIDLGYSSLAQPYHLHILLNNIRAPLLRRVAVSHDVDSTVNVDHLDVFPRHIHPPTLPKPSGLRLVMP